jgi:hypothetical protein
MQRASLLLLLRMDDVRRSLFRACSPPLASALFTEWNHVPFGKGWVVRCDHRPYDSRHDSVTREFRGEALCDKST